MKVDVFGQAFALSYGAMICPFSIGAPRRKAVWGPKRILAAAVLMGVALVPNATAAGLHSHSAAKSASGRPNSRAAAYKLDTELETRATTNSQTRTTRVIVELVAGAKLPAPFAAFAKRDGQLGIINGQVVDLPDRLLRQMAQHPSVFRIHYDRPAAKFNYRTSMTVGTRVVRQTLGLTGAGIGVAVIDSGIATWHDDLTNTSSTLYPYGNQRVAKFVDFVNGRTQPYDDNGHGTHYGGIIAPGNAPWVLTVGGSSTLGTTSRGDDVMGGFSSRGPSYIDWNAKPDVVAPGTGSVSLAAAGSHFYQTKAASLLAGTIATASLPYLSLTGTSMAAPVVAGTVALMLQANPSLTPNAVKSILQYTAEDRGYNGLTQGAGFLNAVGAVRLARFYVSAKPGDKVPVQKMWSRRVIWGTHVIGNGVLDLSKNAFRLDTTWGVAQTDLGDNLVWGTATEHSD